MENNANSSATGSKELLIIDDDPLLQEMLEISFSGQFQVSPALSGRGGLDLIADPERKFDCVLLDYQLPGIDGITVLQQIREIDPVIPVIFMTGFGDLQLVKTALSLGANEYCTKPVKSRDLQNAISKWVPGAFENENLVSTPETEQRNIGENTFSGKMADGSVLEGRLVRFGSQSAVVDLCNKSKSPVRIEEVKIELGRFSLDIGPARILSNESTPPGTVEIAMPGHWSVSCQSSTGVVPTGRVEKRSTRLPGRLQAAVSDLAELLKDIDSDLDAMEHHLGDWSGQKRSAMEQAFIAQVEKDYFPVISAAVARFEAGARDIKIEADPAAIQLIREQLYPMLLASPFISRVIEKPIGVPGDFGVLGQILGDSFEGHSLYSRALNGWILNSGAAKAYRHRVNFLENQMKSTLLEAAGDGRKARFLSIGSGVAFEVQRIISQFPEAEAEFHLVDFSEETISEAMRQIRLCQADSGCSTVEVSMQNRSVTDLIRQSRSENRLDGLAGYDFVWCTGLFDYLPDRLCGEVTRYVTDSLRPGGKAAVSNFTPENPIRRFMDLVLDWRLNYRSTDEFQAVTTGENRIDTLFTEPCGVEVYNLLEKS